MSKPVEEDFELGSEELANLPHNHPCFLRYKPRDILKNSQKALQISFVENHYTNPHTVDSTKQLIYEVRVTDIKTQNLIIKEKSFVCNKVDGRFKTFLKVLANRRLFGPEYMWNELVDKTEKLVNKQRDERNAMEKPVYK